jgi:3'(2'), 5'-bisphosphate nucleotidase
LKQIYLTAIEAAVEAGKEIMKVYTSNNFQITEKLDDSPLTIADQLSNKVIVEALSNTNIHLISEEEKQIDYATRKEWSQCWMIDPLDGTKEFIKRNGEFTVNIALVRNQQPIFGVIYVPATQELFIGDVDAHKSIKLSLKDHLFAEEQLASAEEIQPDKAISSVVKVVGSRSHMNRDTLQFVEALKAQQKEVEIVSKGSSLKFCLVAEGKAHVYPRFAPTMEWDTAAGHAICKAVGIAVTDGSTIKEIRYNKDNLLNPSFIVTLNYKNIDS